MTMISAKTPFAAFIAKIQQMQDTLNAAMQKAIDTSAQMVTTNLSGASPTGAGSAQTIPGDQPGPLKNSFTAKPTGGSLPGTIICTIQPTKLKFVRYGTGIYGPNKSRIYPKAAKALFWEGADRPYRSVAGQKPNDFVTPVLMDGKQTMRAAVVQAVHDLVRL